MNEKTLKDLLSSLKTAGKPKTSAYDTQATVTRVENGVAWVHIPGGVTETPVKLTISAKAGDTVQVRVSGGRAFMVGNASAPPTDDTVAQKAVRQVRTISKVVEKVRQVAETASRIAGNTNQYFWHTETGSDTGAHITEIPREDFLADPTNGGGNLLARSNGIAVRDGLTELSSFSDGDIQLGPDSDYHVNIQPQGIDFYTANGATPISSINVKVDGNKQNTCQYYDNEDVYILGGHGRQSRAGRYINDLQLIASGMSTDNRESEILLSQISDLGSASIAMSNGAISISGQSIIFVNPITANAVQSYTPTWATNQSPANYHCVVSAGLCSFFYQGSGGTHNNQTLLGTLPYGAKPKSIVFCPCVKGANAYGIIKIETNGNIYLEYISSTSATARLYFNCSFPVV